MRETARAAKAAERVSPGPVVIQVTNLTILPAVMLVVFTVGVTFVTLVMIMNA